MEKCFSLLERLLKRIYSRHLVALLSTASTLRATTGHVLNTFVRVSLECLKRLHRQIDNYVLLVMGLGHFRRSRINRYFLQEIKVLTRATTFLLMTDTF